MVRGGAPDSKRLRSTSPRHTIADQGEIGPPDIGASSMKLHPGVKPALWGAAAGAVAVSVVGFSSMGWMLGGTAERLAADRAESAVVEVLTPICVEKFSQQA